MAKNARVALTDDTWTKISAEAVSAFSFQNLGAYSLIIAGTTADAAWNSHA